ncbi:MAG: hypothetical protein ACOYMS_03780 [Terrimicrobiaceae bacterium]
MQQRLWVLFASMPTLLAKNAEILVTMDGERRELRDAGIFVADGIIRQIGPSGSLPPTVFSLDLQTISYAGALHDPVAAPLFSAPQSAKHTVVNGRVVVRDGELTAFEIQPAFEAHNRCAIAMAAAL